MGKYSAISRIMGILVVFISIGWYGNLNHIRENKTTYEKKHHMSYSEAKAKLSPPVYRQNSYYYQNVLIETYSRTFIPFKYKNVSTKTKKLYYSNGKY